MFESHCCQKKYLDFFQNLLHLRKAKYFFWTNINFFCQKYFINYRYDIRFTDDLRPPHFWQTNSNYGSLRVLCTRNIQWKLPCPEEEQQDGDNDDVGRAEVDPALGHGVGPEGGQGEAGSHCMVEERGGVANRVLIPRRDFS